MTMRISDNVPGLAASRMAMEGKIVMEDAFDNRSGIGPTEIEVFKRDN